MDAYTPTDHSRRKPTEPSRRTFLGSAVALGAAAPALVAAASLAQSEDVLDIAIIGAGLAGLTAARDLHRAGSQSFVVLEARNRVGGRTFNHDLGQGVVSEAGGEWIGPGQTAIADLARELGIGIFDTYYRGKTVILSNGSRVTEDTDGAGGGSGPIATKIGALACAVPSHAPWKAPNAAELDKLSLGQWLAQQSLSNEEKFAFSLGANLTYGVPPAQLGLLEYLSMVNSAGSNYAVLESIKGGAQESRIAGGSQLLSIRMAQQLGDKVRLSSPVRRIAGWNKDVVELHTDQGIVRTRRVIVALNPALCNQIAFDPPLPTGRAQLQHLWPAYSPMRKTVHVYEKPFWRDDGLNGQITPLDGPLMWSIDNSPPDGSLGVLMAFVRAAYLPADPKAAEPILSAIYARALGDKARHPIQYHDMDWGGIDRWSLTCIAPIPAGFWTRWGEFLRPETGRLIWSGTETADIWAGSMDGAVRSGHRAALQALGKVRE